MSRAEFFLLFILCAPGGLITLGLLQGDESPVAVGSVLSVLCAPFVLGYVFSKKGQGNG